MASKTTRASKIRGIEIADSAAAGTFKIQGNTIKGSAPKKAKSRAASSQGVKEFGGDNIEAQIAEWLESGGVVIELVAYAYTSPTFHGALILYHTA